MDRIHPAYSSSTRFFLPFEIHLPVQPSWPKWSMSSWITISSHSTSDFFVKYFHQFFFSNNLGDIVSCSRSFLYLSLIKLPPPSLFTPISTPSSSNLAYWLSSTFNTRHLAILRQTILSILSILSILRLQLQLQLYSIIRSLEVLYGRTLS